MGSHRYPKETLKESLQPLVGAIKEIAPKKEKPGFLEKCAKGLNSVLKILATLILLVVAAGITKQVWKQCRTEVVIIEAFSVSPDLDRLGYTPKNIADAVMDRCERIIRKTEAGIDLGKFERPGEDQRPDIEIPDTRVSLRSFVNYFTDILGKHPTRVSGEFVGLSNALTLTVRITPGSPKYPQNGWDRWDP